MGTYMFHIDRVCKRYNNSILLGEVLVLVWVGLWEKNGDDFGRMHGWYGQKNWTNVGRLSEAICSEESVILGRDVNRNFIFLFVICS